jgi:diguanylate cyclase (GGDEF)-like protein
VRRLETINNISHKIASTIEVDQVICLVSAAVQEALNADTYFVGLVQGENLRLDLFYDDGEFFSPREYPLRGGLVGWVLENRKPLLMGNVPRESEQMGISVRIIGKPKSSLSWMGTPILAGDQLIGIIAIASYQANAFDRVDLELLENMAHQAAMVIDNAYHHAEVKRQSQLDSLTQVYNHGKLLAYLADYARDAQVNKTPLSLIMLDVDFFKHYNDVYGHQVGDQALHRVVSAVRQNVRSSDIVGRWGGEEFVVILPDTHGRQAMQVAERIRLTLRMLAVKLSDGQQVPTPTVSQGIAMFWEAPEAEKLIDLADQRLYIAKARGRDQVEPGEAHWETFTS